MKISPADMSGFDGLGDEWNHNKLRYIFLHNRWYDMWEENLKRNNFLARHITDVIYLNATGERLLNDMDAAFNTNDVARIIIQVEHIDITYEPPQQETNALPSLSASNLKLNAQTTDDGLVAKNALAESITAALSLVQTAQSLGWKSISYQTVTNPIDRAALHMACGLCHMETSEPPLTLQELPVLDILSKHENPQEALIEAIRARAKEIVQDNLMLNLDIEPTTYPVAELSDEAAWEAFDQEATYSPSQP